jgi:hypothetical protein
MVQFSENDLIERPSVRLTPNVYVVFGEIYMSQQNVH